MKTNDERRYWLGFSVFPGIGPMKFSQLLSKFGSAKNAWNSPKNDFKKIIGPAITEKFISFRSSFDLQNYADKLNNKKVSYVTINDKEYPQNLKQIKNPPFVLYCMGQVKLLNQDTNTKFIGVVGTRKVTQYGQEVTEMITEELVAGGCVIVSGLATGVDAIAHRTTIDNKGRTIAVLGCGVDVCYPSSNQQVYDNIIANGGLIVSEYPLSQLPTKGSFPSRNRIIAGLTDAIIVTEGAEDSGALITAEFAIEFDRKVFAVPGPITSQLSKGPNSLIGKGAKLVTGGKDILKELQILNDKYIISNKREIKGDTKEEQMIIDLLQNESLHFDELIKKASMSSSDLGSLLSLMEVKGILKGLDNGFFAIV